MSEIGRVLAFLFMCGVVGLLEYAVIKAFAGAFRAVRRDARAWRERRRDQRALREYESDFAHIDERAWRGEP
ncbi:hypothetical protein AB0I81_22505 [Nonomuraea sp. NPDC050404]|uniref:hypothetical protein n=1 Tax=Nonomuraea sp. NPDC050404 TaxID=3155783 RepID=UPI0033DC4BAF